MGLFMCRIASLFLLQRLKEVCQATRAISTKWRLELSSSTFFFAQGKAPKKIHAILIETLRKYAPSYATVKNLVALFKRGDFSTCDAPGHARPPQRLLIKFRS